MSGSRDLHDKRKNYHKHELSEHDISADPFEQFGWWLEDAEKNDDPEPTAMVLSTATKEGKPSSRVVLLKAYDSNGYIFYTNYHSRKGREIAENNNGCLLFYWDYLERQVRIEGTIEKIDVQLSENYFTQRPFESQLSAIVSEQSEVIPSREFLEDKLIALQKAGEVKRPEHWGGYILKPDYFEFWQGRPSRLHDRIVYEVTKGKWETCRLAP